ncbi:hypothetical protein D3C84_375800 [compost metagenome]
MLRTDTKFLLHASDIHHTSGHGIDQRNVPVDQLCHVLVASGNDHRAAGRGTAARQGADHVVGFDAIDTQQRVAERPHTGMQRLDLHPQVIRHARAVGLVFGKQLIAKGTALGVEHHREQAVRVLLAQAFEHVQHALDGAGGQPLGRGQRRQRVKGAVQV